MRLLFTTLLLTRLLSVSYGMTDCPPAIINGKLYGILPLLNQKVGYSEVTDCGTVSQADLFRRVRLWAAQQYHAPGDTFTLSDKESGDLVGRVTQVVTLPRSANSAGGVYTFRYSLTIECTNRRYRATISGLELTEAGSRAVPVETYCQPNEADLRTLYTTLDKQLNARLTSLQESVKTYKPF